MLEQLINDKKSRDDVFDFIESIADEYALGKLKQGEQVNIVDTYNILKNAKLTLIKEFEKRK